MKKPLSILALVALALNCFATGAQGINPPQNGIINVTVNNTTSYTNTFIYPYQSTPVVFLYNLGVTNALPLTNVVTTTNFIVSWATATNVSIAWQSLIGTPTIQTGSFTNASAVSQSVVFARPFAQLPTVTLTSSTTNSGTAAITAVTLTNFTVLQNLSTTNYYTAFGISPIPSDSVNTSAGNNGVKY